MLILAFDTSTDICSIALANGKEIIKEINFAGERLHAQRLFPLMQQLFHETGYKINKTEIVAVGTGPGSFTGIRIAISAAEGLAMAIDKPVIGIMGLEAMALRGCRQGRVVCSMIDARRREIYACVYECMDDYNLKQIIKPAVWPVEEMCDLLYGYADIYIVGSGGVIYQTILKEKLGDKITFAEADDNYPHAGAIAYLAWRSCIKKDFIAARKVEPTYLRQSEAEIRWGNLCRGNKN